MIRSQQEKANRGRRSTGPIPKNGGFGKTVHVKEIFGDTSCDEGGEISVGQGVEFEMATMRTGIQYWYDTRRSQEFRSTSPKEITDATMGYRRDGD
jgi:hypothetical protein